MASNAIAGASERAVNVILNDLFWTIQPSGIFDFGVEIDAAGIAKVDITIVEPPKVSLKSTVPSQIKEDVLNGVKEARDVLDIDPFDKAVIQNALDAVARTTISANFPVVKVRLHYSNAKPDAKPLDLEAGLALVLGLQLDTETSPVAGKVSAISAQAIIDNPALENILNNAIIPRFLPDLNEKVLKTISIPTISVLNTEISVPAPSVEDGYLVAYADLGPYTPPIPQSGNKWSTDSVFVCVDAQFLSTVISPELRNLSIPKAYVAYDPLALWYQVEFSGLDSVDIGASGEITASARIAGKVGFVFNHGISFLPKPTYSIDAYGSVGLTASATIFDQAAYIKVHNIDKFTFDIQATSTKPWAGTFFESKIDQLIGSARDRLVDQYLKPKVMEELGGKWFRVADVPFVPIRLGPGFQIGFEKVETSREVRDGTPYLMAYGMPKITKL